MTSLRLFLPRVLRPVASRRVLGLVLAASAALACLGAAQPAWADDVLADSPVVRRALQYRASRHEVSGLFGATLGDPFVRNLLPGVRYDLHMYDWLSLGGELLVGIPVNTDMRDQVEAKVSKNNVTFIMETTRLRFLTGLHASVSPLVGKFVAFGSLPIHFDIHANLGAGFAGVAGGGHKLTDGISPALTVGGGLRLFLSRVMAVTADINDVFIERTLAVDRNSQAKGAEYAGNLLFTAGISFFVPPEMQRSE